MKIKKITVPKKYRAFAGGYKKAKVMEMGEYYYFFLSGNFLRKKDTADYSKKGEHK